MPGSMNEVNDGPPVAISGDRKLFYNPERERRMTAWAGEKVGWCAREDLTCDIASDETRRWQVIRTRKLR